MSARLLASACLLGASVRYDGTANATGQSRLERWRDRGWVVPYCPEVVGGLGTPRPPSEIVGGTGGDVLEGEARVVTEDGRDVTDAYVGGARSALRSALEHGVDAAVLKARSPSCGRSRIYDGSFDDTTRPGRGVTAALLERHAIRVFDERQLGAAERFLSHILAAV